MRVWSEVGPSQFANISTYISTVAGLAGDKKPKKQ
jgi:hypothetical protein